MIEQLHQFVDRLRVGGGGADDRARSRLVGRFSSRGAPVVHRRDDDRRASSRDCFVVRAADRPGKILRANRLVDPDRVLAGERAQPTCQERLVSQVAAILLTDEDDEWRPIDARGRERADRIAEPGGRVQEHERGLFASDRPARRDTDDRCLVKSEHELEIVRKTCQERHLGRPRVGK